MPEDKLRSLHPTRASSPDVWHEPADSKVISGIIAQIANSDSIETVERTLESALESLRLTRMKRDRERFGDG